MENKVADAKKFDEAISKFLHAHSGDLSLWLTAHNIFAIDPVSVGEVNQVTTAIIRYAQTRTTTIPSLTPENEFSNAVQVCAERIDDLFDRALQGGRLYAEGFNRGELLQRIASELMTMATVPCEAGRIYCAHSMFKPECLGCWQGHAARLESLYDKLRASVALPIKERVEMIVLENVTNWFQVWSSVPKDTEGWIKNAAHYLSWCINQDLPMTAALSPSSSAEIARKAANKIACAIDIFEVPEWSGDMVEQVAAIITAELAATPAETGAIVDEVTRRMDAVVDAAVAWRQWETGDEGEALETAVDSLLELRAARGA